MTDKMKEAYNHLPIVRYPIDSPLKRMDEGMFYQGKSGIEYRYNTLKALMIRGLIQYIPDEGFHKLIKKTIEHNRKGFDSWNQMFL